MSKRKPLKQKPVKRKLTNDPVSQQPARTKSTVSTTTYYLFAITIYLFMWLYYEYRSSEYMRVWLSQNWVLFMLLTVGYFGVNYIMWTYYGNRGRHKRVQSVEEPEESEPESKSKSIKKQPKKKVEAEEEIEQETDEEGYKPSWRERIGI